MQIYKCEIKIKIPKLSSDVESWMGHHDARERERKKLGLQKLNRNEKQRAESYPEVATEVSKRKRGGKIGDS